MNLRKLIPIHLPIKIFPKVKFKNLNKKSNKILINKIILKCLKKILINNSISLNKSLHQVTLYHKKCFQTHIAQIKASKKKIL